MDLFKKAVFSQIHRLTRQDEVDPFEYALLLKEALRYDSSDAFILYELGAALFRSGLTWEAYTVLERADRAGGGDEARRIMSVVENPPVPRNVFIEVSTACRLRCPLCRNGADQLARKGHFMAFDDFRTIWRKLRAGTENLFLTGQGEFFMHERAYDILDEAGKTARVAVDTNGDEALDADRILTSGLGEIIFSIDGLDPAMYEQYRRGGRFQRVADNLKRLIRARDRSGNDALKICVQFLLFKHTEMYEAEAREWFGSLGVDEFTAERPSFEPRYGREAYRDYMPLATGNQRLEYVDFTRNEVGRIAEDDSRHCLLAMENLVVDVNGDVAVCPGADTEDVPPFGNLLRQEPDEVWGSRAAREFRFQVFRDKIGQAPCGRCALPLTNNARFFEGTDFAEEPPPMRAAHTRIFTRDNRVGAEEMKRLRAGGRDREADYFQSLGKAETPEPVEDEDILDILEQLGTGAVDIEATRKEASAAAAGQPGDYVQNAADEYNIEAGVHFRQRDYEKASALLKEALKIDPYHRDALKNLANVMKKIDSPREAHPYLDHYLLENPNDKEMRRIRSVLAEPSPIEESKAVPAAEAVVQAGSFRPAPPHPDPEVNRLNRDGIARLDNREFDAAKDFFVRSLATDPDQPEIRQTLLDTLWALLKAHQEDEAAKSSATPISSGPEDNSHGTGFLKHVPDDLAPHKTGLKILYLSDRDVAGYQSRFMGMLNRRTIHCARNVFLQRGGEPDGEDLVPDSDETFREAAALIREADFFHFMRGIPPITGIDWSQYLTRQNCLVDYYGDDIKFNKKNLAEFHRRTGIVGLTKHDFGMYYGAESLMYHFAPMFDPSNVEDTGPDLGYFDKPEVVIGHALINPETKRTHELLPLIERVNRRTPRELKVRLIVAATRKEATRAKADCDIFIELVRPQGDHLSGSPGPDALEALAQGKVTICSLDNFYLSIHPDAPIFTCGLDDFEDLLIRILSDREFVQSRMKNVHHWLRRFAPRQVLGQYLQIYQYVMTGNRFVDENDDFFSDLLEAGHDPGRFPTAVKALESPWPAPAG